MRLSFRAFSTGRPQSLFRKRPMSISPLKFNKLHQAANPQKKILTTCRKKKMGFALSVKNSLITATDGLEKLDLKRCWQHGFAWIDTLTRGILLDRKIVILFSGDLRDLEIQDPNPTGIKRFSTIRLKQNNNQSREHCIECTVTLPFCACGGAATFALLLI